MRYPPSIGSIDVPEEPSVGSYLTSYMQVLSPAKFGSWMHIDENEHCRAEFKTTVHVTEGHVQDLPATAYYRAACIYALGHLSERSLEEACNAILDIYQFQSEGERLEAPQDDSAPSTLVRKAIIASSSKSRPLSVSE